VAELGTTERRVRFGPAPVRSSARASGERSVEAAIDLPGEPASVAAARAFVRGRLAAWQASGLEQAASIVVSELVSNAVVHARSPFRLHVALAHGTLTLEVGDDSSQPPVRTPPGPHAETGRGLEVVQALSAGWGYRPAEPPPGKVVWAEIR
jgi:anti-sigma regulatory factor (Ser/Thr protein kinase)